MDVEEVPTATQPAFTNNIENKLAETALTDIEESKVSSVGDCMK